MIFGSHLRNESVGKVVLLAAAAACLIVWYFYTPGSDGEQAVLMPPPAVPQERQTEVTPSAEGAGRRFAVAESKPPSAALAREFGAATDWRSFALNARQRPEEGGHFYAMLVSDFCGMDAAAMPELARDAVSDSLAKTGTVTVATQKLTEKFVTLCAGFLPKEASELYRELKGSSSSSKDPLVNAARALAQAIQGADVRSTRRALQHLLSLSDPTLAHSGHLLEQVMLSNQNAGAKGSLRFDGNSYSANEPDGLASIGLALKLAACRDGFPCPLDTSMMISCLGGIVCTESREQYLRQVYVEQAGMTDAWFAQATALGGRLRQAVDDQDVDAFVR